MKAIYYLPFISAYLIYSARDRGFHLELSQAKVILAIVFLIIPAIYWIIDKRRGNRR